MSDELIRWEEEPPTEISFSDEQLARYDTLMEETDDPIGSVLQVLDEGGTPEQYTDLGKGLLAQLGWFFHLVERALNDENWPLLLVLADRLNGGTADSDDEEVPGYPFAVEAAAAGE